AAATPVVLNIVLSVALLWAARSGADVGRALAWGVPVAGVAQLALVWWAAARAGYRLVPRLPLMTPELKRLAVIAAPAALAGGVLQINLLVGRQVASFFEGSIQYLNLADRLYQLPLGVVAIAIGVVLLPELARRLQAGDTETGRAAFNRAAEFALFLTLPAAVALFVVPLPLVSVLFERGRFGAQDAAATATAVAVYGLGLPAFVMQKVLQPLYFAREDTRTPFRYALVAMLVNAVVALSLAPVIGFLAAAIATSLAGWAMVILLWRGSRRMGRAARPDGRLVRRAARIALASIGMGLVLMVCNAFLAPMFDAGRWRYLALLLLVSAGMLSFFIIAQLIGAMRLAEVRATLGR
ncbi:MAG: murein biosynthesis integral membrane protein MurJ, partial [Paracoccaceae bacterium]